MNAPESITASVLRRRAEAGDLWLPTSGASMGSRYPLGSRLLVRPSREAPRLGEIWAFVDAEDRVVVHRCVWNRSDHAFRFRGDAVCSLDPPVATSHLIGRVIEVDDGVQRWSPRVWHAVSPTVKAFARAARARLRRVRHSVPSSLRQAGRK